MLFAGWPAFFNARSSRRGVGLVLAVMLAASVLVVAGTPAATAQPDSAGQSAAERCSAFHLFGAEPVDVAKTADGQTVLAQVSWGWDESIGCYLALGGDAVAALRAAGRTESLPQGQTAASMRCFEHHRFGAEPVDAAKTADGQTVLARLSWGWDESIGCYLALDSTAVATLRAAADTSEPPGAPGNVEATAGDGQITVAWTAPDDGGAPIADYTVAYQADTAACPTDIDNSWNPRITSSTSTTLGGLANGTAYRVCVRATNRAGDSTWSGTTATPATVPGAPGSVEATAGDGQLTATWTAPDDGGAPITGYTVAYQANAFTCPTATTIGAWNVRTTSATSTTIGGLANSNQYRLCVRATNSAGNSIWSGTNSSPSDRPGRPASVQFAGTGPDRLTVAWAAPASVGASGITGYTVQWCTASAAINVCASSWSSASATGTSHTIGGLAGGTSFGVRVQALNSRGTGPWSSTRFATTAAATPPGTPTGLVATIDDGQIDLRWNAPSNNGAPITGYSVECRLGGTAIAAGSCGSIAWTNYTSVSGTSATLSGLSNGTPYDIRVRAANRIGNSAWTTTTATPAAPPRIPANVVASPSGRNIQVTWTAPASGGSPISSYTVQYCSGACTSWRSTTVTGNPPATSVTIAGLSTGTTYRVRVQALNSAGMSGWSATDSATTPSRPGAPTGLTITSVGRSELTAIWTAPASPSGISGYNVQRCNARANNDGTWSCSSGWSNAGTASSTTHTVTGLTGNTAYRVRAQAFNAAGVSGWSNAYTATTNPPDVPGAPSGLTATPNSRQIRLSWAAPAANGARITRYTVYCQNNGDTTTGSCRSTDWTRYTTTSGTSITIGGLTNGNEYSVRVFATNSAGDGGTTSATATPATRPGPPTDIEIVPSYPGGGGLTLAVSWTAPTDQATGGSAITGYTVQYRASNGNWSFAHAGGASTLEISITGLTVGPRYYVQIRSINAAGESNWVQASSDPTGTPAKPADPTISSVSRGELTIGWSAPDQGASAITDYGVQWCTARERTVTNNGVETTTYPCTGSWRTAADADIDATSTSHTVTGLTGATGYSVRVRAVNRFGNGPWSDVSFATTDAPAVPDAPSGLTATPDSGRIALRWAAPAANGARITRYTVDCQNNGDTTTGSCRFSDWTRYTTTSGTSITIGGLTNGNEYSVRVFATNSAGDGGTTSATATPATRPGRPTDIVFAETYPEGGGVTLNVAWKAPENFGGTAITGYTLQYRVRGGNWSFAYFGVDTSYSITGLIVGRRYDVQIRSHNVAGESGWAQASTAPTGRPAAPSSLSVSAAGSGELSVSWTAPDQGASDITGYNIQRCTARETTNNDGTTTSRCISGWSSAGTASSDSHTIVGLADATYFGVRVQAVNSQGSGPWSETEYGTTS
ncbi:fibronectin type III domain-containing protein [Candidatus Poriferisocius sp.]|uniref:fibronectin type III domain-containing protein n=1 Tax=Candidatus Poriferisocius sp. TaxID=3101276 RepID=UPI003B0185E9